MCFSCESYSDVIIDHIYSLFKHLVFIPSSNITGLDDSTIIIRFGGDKGGKTMAFKFGGYHHELFVTQFAREL
jgi:hypothetical protein